MTINSEQIQSLRAAAESCDKQEPLSLVVYHGKMCLRNKGGIVFTVLRDICFPEYSTENENYARLAELCTPDSILSLLAERDADKALIAEQAKSIDFLKEQLAQLANFNPDWGVLQSAMDGLREHVVNKLLERIAELEGALNLASASYAGERERADALQARTVKLPESFTKSMYGTPLYEHGDIVAMLAAAGITLDVGE